MCIRDRVPPAREVGPLLAKSGVLLVGLRALLGGPLAGVLDRHGGDDDEDLGGAAEPVGLDEHAPEAWVDGQAGEGLAGRGEATGPLRPGLRVEGLQLLQQTDTVGDLTGVRRLDEGEARDVCLLYTSDAADDAPRV